MYDVFFVLRSVTRAQQAKAALEEEGIACFQRRSPRGLSQTGCAYALCVSTRDMEAAERLLKRRAPEYQGPYLRRLDGSFTEVGP